MQCRYVCTGCLRIHLIMGGAGRLHPLRTDRQNWPVKESSEQSSAPQQLKDQTLCPNVSGIQLNACRLPVSAETARIRLSDRIPWMQDVEASRGAVSVCPRKRWNALKWICYVICQMIPEPYELFDINKSSDKLFLIGSAWIVLFLFLL